MGIIERTATGLRHFRRFDDLEHRGRMGASPMRTTEPFVERVAAFVLASPSLVNITAVCAALSCSEIQARSALVHALRSGRIARPARGHYGSP